MADSRSPDSFDATPARDYRYRGKSFDAAVNGSTGTVTGQLPDDWFVIAIGGLILLAVAAALLYGVIWILR